MLGYEKGKQNELSDRFQKMYKEHISGLIKHFLLGVILTICLVFINLNCKFYQINFETAS